VQYSRPLCALQEASAVNTAITAKKIVPVDEFIRQDEFSESFLSEEVVILPIYLIDPLGTGSAGSYETIVIPIDELLYHRAFTDL
jgi:hypothetical protein